MTHAVASIETSYQLIFSQNNQACNSKLDSNSVKCIPVLEAYRLVLWARRLLGRCAAAGCFLTTHKSCSFASHVAVWIGDAFKQVRWSVQSTISKCKIFPRKNKTKYYTANNFCKFSRKLKATTHCSDWGTEQITSWLTLLYLFLENIA